MSVAEPQQGEVFSVRIFKQFQGYKWANTYEIRARDNVTYDDLRQAAITIADFERRPLHSFFVVSKATISTYVPDSRPYNPDSFTTVNLDLRGQLTANPSLDLLPLEICVFARKNTLVGRPGKAFFRGFLYEEDVSWGGDRFLIRNQRTDQIANELNTMLVQLRARKFEMVLARGRQSPENVRPVINFVVTNRTSTKQLDNRYFDVRDRQ